MDDFGTGYSSLGYLWRFPFDKIKIDRSFMIGWEARDRHVAHILRTIVSLGRTLDMLVTAEGVEAAEQASLLRELGCDFLQGYHFSRPLPEAEVLPYLLRTKLWACLAEEAQRRPPPLQIVTAC
jgi:EAL domain-containing protein (putative c-di-GMP-specific phosphodiesterase class I)